jgi:hypothetical protein
MKTLIKITALAVLAALAAFSCVPEAELSGVDWSEVNSKYNSGKNSSPVFPTGFDISSALSTEEGAANELDLTFPVVSDFLRNSSEASIQSGLRQFLSFHHFTKSTDVGKVDTLEPALPYIYVKRNGNVITVKLNKTFVETDSSVIMKIDGTKYTFGNGNKLDLRNRGKSGETGYDDFYAEIDVYGATGPTDFTGPQFLDWRLTLSSLYESPSNATEAPPLFFEQIATLSLPEADYDTYTTVSNQLKSGLKIQRFKNGAWGDVSGTTINYESLLSSSRSFYVRSLALTFEEFVPFRVVWEGSAPIITSAEYFGLKQYIKIVGANTPSSAAPAWYRTSRVNGSVSNTVWYNTYDGRRFRATEPFVINVAKDSHRQNVVIEVLFGSVTYGTPPATYWLKDFNSNKQKFKDNFKIAYYSNGGSNANSFTSQNDVVYIPIKDFEFFSHNPEGLADVGLNAIRITLDPNYKNDSGKTKYFYISPEIRYEDEKTTFGSSSNFMNGCFAAYSAGTF